MLVLRSIAFNILFYLNMVVFLIGSVWAFAAPPEASVRCMKAWARASLWLLKHVARIDMKVEGAEYLPKGAALIAGKHQSFWETFAIMPLLENPCMVLKKELTRIPFFGWYAVRGRMIGVERSAGASAIKNLVMRGKEEAANNRQIVILPEGTRKAPGDPPDYKPGAAALYSALNLPCVPFGLNAGQHWPRRKFLRYPGTITIAFCPPIPAGLPRREFQARMEAAIETTTNRLLALPK